MTADDLLPIFIYVFVASSPQHLSTPVRLLSTLQTRVKHNAELEYYCTSMTLALIYIVQQQRDKASTAHQRCLAASGETINVCGVLCVAHVHFIDA